MAKINKYILFGVTKFDEWHRIIGSSSIVRLSSYAYHGTEHATNPYVRLVIVKEMGSRPIL